MGSAPGLSDEIAERLSGLFTDDYRHAGKYRNPGPLRCALYRHFDKDGLLLYVGVADTPRVRTHTHARESAWAVFAANAEMEWFPSRAEALEAEAEIIRDECPVFNWTHGDKDRSERVKRYLIAQKAWDFLEVSV